MARIKAERKEGAGRKRVTFCLTSPYSREVSVAGTFNGWDPATDVMKRKDGGRWVLVKYLPPGIYEYRFVVDGIWTTDPTSQSRRFNIYGTENSVIEV